MTDFIARTTQIPIAELSPLLPTPATKSIRAIVTLIWPYSSSNSSFTVLLAEPDFRLRRSKGQVRVQFLGSSAKTAFETGIGSGDEVILSLEGVEWVEDKSANYTPGRSIEWELKFTERLLLQIQDNDTQRVTLLNIDHPEPRSKPAPLSVASINEPTSAFSSPDPVIPQLGRPAIVWAETGEWSSPAFVKRARVSYGSLFESGYDIFADDDRTVEGRGRKRTRFSRQSGNWRYSSRSISPRAERFDAEMANDGPSRTDAGNKPLMTDEDCQTQYIEDDGAAEALADLSQQEVASSSTAMLPSTLKTVQRTIGVSDTLGNPDNVSPPPGSYPSTGVGFGAQNPVQMPAVETNSMPPISPRLHPVPSDALPLVSPLVSRALDTAHEHRSENGSLYGHSASWNEGSELQTNEEIQPFEENVNGAMLALDSSAVRQSAHAIEFGATSSIGFKDIIHIEPANQYGHSQLSVAGHDRLSRSISPPTQEEPIQQTYPELGINEHQDYVQTSDPYYRDERNSPSAYRGDDTLQTYPDLDKDLLNLPSLKPWNEDIEGNEHQYINSNSKLLYAAKDLMAQTSIAISRSQSVPSEIVDLTKDNEKEAEEMNDEGMGSEGEISSSEPQFGGSLAENKLEPREEDDSASQDGDDLLDVESDEEFDDEHEEEYEDIEDHHKYLPGFRPVNRTECNAWSDSRNSLEEDDEEYDEDQGQSEEESVPAVTKQPTRAKPEVIDLLSSDEEEGCKDGEKKEEVNGGRNQDDEKADDGCIEDHPRVTNEFYETPTRELVHNILNELGEDEYHEDEYHEDEYHEDEYREGDVGHQSQDLEDENGEDDLSDEGHRDRDLEDENRKYDFNDIGNQVQDIEDEDHKSQGSEDQIFQGEVHIQEVEREISYGDPGHIRSETTDNRGTKMALMDNEQDVSDESVSTEYEIEADDEIRTPRTSQALIYLPIESEFNGKTQHDSKPQSPPLNDQSNSSQENGMSGYLSIPGELLNEAQKEPKPLYLDGTNELTPTGISYSITSPEQSNTEMHGQSKILEKDYINKSDNGQLPTPNATQLMEVISSEVSFGSTSATQQLVLPQSQSQIQEGSVTAGVEENFETDEYTSSGKVPHSPAATDALEVAPTTPIKAHNIISMESPSERTNTSPIIVGDEPSPQGYDASAELAIAALDSPSKQDQTTPALSDTALRALLNRSLRTSLGEFTALSLVRFSLEKKLDILAIVTNHPPEPQRAKAGPRQLLLRFNVTDPSIAPNGVTEIQIFRPHEEALPSVQPGDGVLIRNFRVKSERNHGFALRSEDNSSWLVFKQDGREENPGPPVELGDSEREHMLRLKTWYISLNEIYKEKLERVNGDRGASRKVVGKPL